MSITSSLKSIIKKAIQPAPKVVREFDPKTLPWIDRPGADIDGFAKKFAGDHQGLSYDMAEKLHFWQKNGFVILEKAIAPEWADQLWRETEELIEHNEQYKVNIRVDLPEYQAAPVQEARALPKSVLGGKYIKFMDFHNSSIIGKKIMLHRNIVTFLEAVFGERVVAMQSLLFKFGSQQATHQDFAYVVSEIPSHLAAAWIALEDVQFDAGPLYYYPGSHKIKKFDFGNGIFFNGESTYNPDDFARYLDKVCQEAGMERQTLLIKKGDVLLWHASLAHGGDPIRNADMTRKSYVCHYSSVSAYKHHRLRSADEPQRYSLNGADVFLNPSLPDQEDIFRAGETM
ncbi:phytanoyl-CoA dioxygenase family protein [Fibrella arboris]|uniref:phytanoyl-CoA dioxygenase family protein n=1 Tax=Fibrella arboris TaxID=3242486 RepID=UPI00352157F0